MSEHGAPRDAKVQLCPECGRGNIGGTKYCYGDPASKHEPVRWEWVVVVPRDAYRQSVASEIAEALREHATTYANEADRHPWYAAGEFVARGFGSTGEETPR